MKQPTKATVDKGNGITQHDGLMSGILASIGLAASWPCQSMDRSLWWRGMRVRRGQGESSLLRLGFGGTQLSG